ncbi:hypothetical protein [Paenibacillus sp. GCM10012303]|uniref:hypothetical protein n=1 Tax=Paenibacillus sp. GCM10012303 TaxID=3317340 RepID=UPI00361D6F20
MRTSAGANKLWHPLKRAAGWGVAVMTVIPLLGCGSTPATKNGVVKFIIESDVSTAAKVFLELKTRNGTNSREEADILLPYTLELPVDHSKPMNFKSAKLSAEASAAAKSITCRIFYDGKKVSESTVEGNAPTATCESDNWPGALGK